MGSGTQKNPQENLHHRFPMQKMLFSWLWPTKVCLAPLFRFPICPHTSRPLDGAQGCIPQCFECVDGISIACTQPALSSCALPQVLKLMRCPHRGNDLFRQAPRISSPITLADITSSHHCTGTETGLQRSPGLKLPAVPILHLPY